MDRTALFLEGVARDIRDRLDGWDPEPAVDETVIQLLQELPQPGADWRMKASSLIGKFITQCAVDSVQLVIDEESLRLVHLYNCEDDLDATIHRTLTQHPLIRRVIADVERQLGIHPPHPERRPN